MEILARSGHFSQVVIVDGNLPVGAIKKYLILVLHQESLAIQEQN